MGIDFRQNGDGSLDFLDELTSNKVLTLKPQGNNYHDLGDRVTVMDDFFGPNISTFLWGVNKGSDAGCANFAINAATSGTARATMGANAGVSMATNGVQINGALNWKASNGNLVFETRVALQRITNIALFVGFTNQVASLQMPVNSSGSGNNLTYNANDCVGWLFDTSMTTANFWLTGQKGGTPITAVNSGVAPVAATYDTLRVIVDASGTATFFRNGLQVGAPIANAITAGTAVTPVIAGFTRSAATATLDADYIFSQQAR